MNLDQLDRELHRKADTVGDLPVSQRLDGIRQKRRSSAKCKGLAAVAASGLVGAAVVVAPLLLPDPGDLGPSDSDSNSWLGNTLITRTTVRAGSSVSTIPVENMQGGVIVRWKCEKGDSDTSITIAAGRDDSNRAPHTFGVANCGDGGWHSARFDAATVVQNGLAWQIPSQVVVRGDGEADVDVEIYADDAPEPTIGTTTVPAYRLLDGRQYQLVAWADGNDDPASLEAPVGADSPRLIVVRDSGECETSPSTASRCLVDDSESSGGDPYGAVRAALIYERLGSEPRDIAYPATFDEWKSDGFPAGTLKLLASASSSERVVDLNVDWQGGPLVIDCRGDEGSRFRISLDGREGTAFEFPCDNSLKGINRESLQKMDYRPGDAMHVRIERSDDTAASFGLYSGGIPTTQLRHVSLPEVLLDDHDSPVRYRLVASTAGMIGGDESSLSLPKMHSRANLFVVAKAYGARNFSYRYIARPGATPVALNMSSGVTGSSEVVGTLRPTLTATTKGQTRWAFIAVYKPFGSKVTRD